MTDYNWCHNPDCHKIESQSRVRGSGENKVLRTRKIPLHRSKDYNTTIWAYFCNNSCLFSFLDKFAIEVTNIRPVKQPSETPIKVVKSKYESYRYEWNGEGGTKRVPYQATRTTISRVDND